METRVLGNTDMHITPIGIGTFAIGGEGWPASWGPQDDNDSIATIQHALDLGINWIDTAGIYAFGHSEEIVARALKGRATRPYIFTKCSRVRTADNNIEGVLKSASIKKEIEDSLRRLQVDVIDLYQLHWPNPDEDIEEGWTTMAELKAEGKVRHIGVSNFNVSQMRRIQPIAPISSLQPPYSLLDRSIEADILPFCQQSNIGTIVYAPMGSGLLTGTWTPERAANLPQDDLRRRKPDFQGARLLRNIALADLLREIGQAHDRSAGETAIVWTLRHPAVTAAIVGGRHPAQIDQIIGAGDYHLTPEEIERIEAFLRANP